MLLITIQVEDIVDTGNTISSLISHLKAKGASSISVCTLLDKPSRRKVNVEMVGEGRYYCGFEVLLPLFACLFSCVCVCVCFRERHVLLPFVVN